MTRIQLGEQTFDRIEYEPIPVYLYVGETGPGTETPEGHIIWHDHTDQIVGFTLVSPQRQLERDHELNITTPDGRNHDLNRLRPYVPDI
jgi:hypothetical protein